MANKSKELIRQISTPVTEVNTDRNYVPILSRADSKLYTFSTCQGISPNNNSITGENMYFSSNKLNKE